MPGRPAWHAGARPERTLLTSVAVVLGVAVVAGTLIFTDTIHRSLRRTFAAADRGAAAIVTGRTGADTSLQAPTIAPKTLERVSRLRDVATAQGLVNDTAALVGTGGRLLNGGRGRAVSFLRPPFQNLEIVDGRPPLGAHDVVIDLATARARRLHLGQLVPMASGRPVEAFRLVGLARYGSADHPGGPVFGFSMQAAQYLFLKHDRFDSLLVSARPGVEPARLVAEIESLLDPQLVARPTSAQVDADAARFADRLGSIEDAVLAFGFVAVGVGALVIFNAFAISLTHRTRQLGLLRAVGATRGQLVRAVLVEAGLVGLLASVAGLAAAFGAAAVLHATISAAGPTLPTDQPVLATRTVLVSLAVGLGLTLATAVGPAIRAGRLAPLATLRHAVGMAPVGPATAWLALGLGGAGVGFTVHGLVAGTGIAGAAVGAMALLIAVVLVSPLLVLPLTNVIDRPLRRVGGATWNLARGFALRSPTRTAASAAAVTVGLTAVLFLTTLVGETRSQVRDAVGRSFAGDLAVTGQSGTAPFPAAATPLVAGVPGVAAAAPLKRASADVLGAGQQSANGIDTQSLGSAYRFDWVAGDDSLLGLLGPDGALVEQALATRAQLHVGSHFTAITAAGRSTDLTVRGIYRDPGLLPGFSIQLPAFNATFHQPRVRRILVKLAPGADPAVTAGRIDRALVAFPEARARSERQLADAEAGRFDTVLRLFYGLLAVTALVAVLGIFTTLSLQTHERARELGMLRAIGASRHTIRAMLTLEGVAIAAIGGLLGLGLGTLLAGTVTASLSQQQLGFRPPWTALAAAFPLAVMLGGLAGRFAGRAAARTEILAAIAYE